MIISENEIATQTVEDLNTINLDKDTDAFTMTVMLTVKDRTYLLIKNIAVMPILKVQQTIFQTKKMWTKKDKIINFSRMTRNMIVMQIPSDLMNIFQIRVIQMIMLFYYGVNMRKTIW